MAQTLKLDDVELRREVRRPVIRKARISLVQDEVWHDCTILNESDSGAQIEIQGELVANDEVTIEFPATGIRLATVRWFWGTRAGLELGPSPHVDRVLERRSITHQSTVELSSKVLETHDDDGIVAITPLNIFSAEEKMGFLGTPDLLTCYGLGQARHAVQETNAVVGKSALYSPESEWTFTDDLTKSIVTGKQAFKLFEVDIARLCISSDQPQQLMDSDFKVPLPSRDQ